MRRSLSPSLVRAGAATAVILTATPFVLISPASAVDFPVTKITGAGSTWSQIAIDDWRANVSQQGLIVDYSGVGSTAGRDYYTRSLSDFSVSEIPFQQGEPNGPGTNPVRPFTYLPIVAGGTSFMYNLKDAAGRKVTDLKLKPATVAKIFTGAITNWNDPLIAADYGKPLPNLRIRPIVRSDGSGTTAQFTLFMLKTLPEIWGPFASSQGIDPNSLTSFYPNFEGSLAFAGSDQVASQTASNSNVGAITYVEKAYAVQKGFPVVSVQNVAGQYRQPTEENVAVALQGAKFNPDRTQVLDDVYKWPDPRAYPLSSYSYMIAPTTGFDPVKGNTLRQFILYFVCDGQRAAEDLGYSPLPPVLVNKAFEAARDIPTTPDGPQVPAAATEQTCGGNPTVGAQWPPPLNPGDIPTTTAPTGGGGTTVPGGGGGTTVPGGGGGGTATTVKPGTGGGGGGSTATTLPGTATTLPGDPADPTATTLPGDPGTGEDLGTGSGGDGSTGGETGGGDTGGGFDQGAVDGTASAVNEANLGGGPFVPILVTVLVLALVFAPPAFAQMLKRRDTPTV